MSDANPPEGMPTENNKELVKEHFNNHYSKLFQSNSQLFEYVRRFKSDAYYMDINGVARKGGQGYKDWLVSKQRPSSEAEARVTDAAENLSHLENFFQLSTLPVDISVFRQVSDRTLDEIRANPDSFIDNGFVSTCISLEDAKKYHKLYTIRIDLPKGTRVIDMTSALKFTEWESDWENELTIDRGYSYKVSEAKTEDYVLILKLENPQTPQVK